jgi:hypothetical protein
MLGYARPPRLFVASIRAMYRFSKRSRKAKFPAEVTKFAARIPSDTLHNQHILSYNPASANSDRR